MKAKLSRRGTNRTSLWWIACGAALWGLDALFILALQRWFTSIQIVWFEHVLLALFAIPVLVLRRREWARLRAADWLAVLFVAWGGSAVASILFNVGLAIGIRSDGVNEVLLLQKLQPVFAVLLAALVLGERVRRAYWPWLVLALSGAYLLTFGWSWPSLSAHASAWAGLCAIGAAFLWGGSTVMGKRVMQKVSFPTMTALRFGAALPLLTVIALLGHPDWSRVADGFHHAAVLGNLLYQTVVPSLLSLLIYYRGLGGVKASYATLAELAFPATGLAVDAIFLHQTVHPAQWLGFALVWTAVYALSRSADGADERSASARSAQAGTAA
ncbi:DMT family transporter [Alicyclobacillus vulcanalis]|uniref:Permease of the drug/metabolite transporter (DMT) superfamily n=1 Tax=Alicyclobacillus vulcanalis TaxID=252246 RepID=A0A1N7PB99_9BACL|nr:DMT family transporter [Alicyclobacillus vulcanalis]SIT07787.1 Permease of the drug/metabolite transporter (DMT) superfamily [Alicyclobacillus vulcanalis]